MRPGTTGVHKNAGDMTNVYVSLTKSFGGGLSAVAEYSTVSKTVSKFTKATTANIPTADTEAEGVTVQTIQDASLDDDEETTNKFLLSLVQSF